MICKHCGTEVGEFWSVVDEHMWSEHREIMMTFLNHQVKKRKMSKGELDKFITDKVCEIQINHGGSVVSIKVNGEIVYRVRGIKKLVEVDNRFMVETEWEVKEK